MYIYLLCVSSVNDQETRECIVLIDTLERKYPAIAAAIFHVPNEGRRSYKAGKTLRRMGLKSGVADYILPVPRCGYGCMVMEYKTQYPRGHITDYQRRWLTHMTALGNFATVCYGVEEAINIITAYWFSDEKTILGVDW